MADGEQTVFCPHCGYPYKMSAVQLDVYRGRNMGCMNCGRPFLVDPPAPPEPVAETSPVGQTADSPQSESKPAATSTVAAKSPAETPGPKRNRLGSVSVGLGLGFLLLLAVGAIIGFIAGGSGDDPAAQKVAYVILAVALAAGLTGVALGVIGYLRSRKPTVGGRGASVAGAALGVAGLLIGGCLLSVLIPTFDRATSQSKKDACRAQLMQIGTALDGSLKAKPNGLYPPDLATLVLEGRIPAPMLLCAGDHSAPPATAPSVQTSYIYLAAGRSRAATPPKFVVAYEAPANHGDGMHVLFGDGMVVLVSTAQATILLNELKSGQNPPPSAPVVRND